MKYVRTKDGRIVEECNLEPGFKQTFITIESKRDNKILRQIVCDDLSDSLERIVVGEYCKCYKINPKDIKYETTTLLNKILKEADTIEELCDEFVYLFEGRHFYCRWNKLIKKWQTLPELFEMSDDKIKTIKGAIWTDKGLIYVAKVNTKGEMELL